MLKLSSMARVRVVFMNDKVRVVFMDDATVAEAKHTFWATPL